MSEIYLVTGLVQKPEMMGHRAYVGDFASKELAIGTAMEKWQVDGWSVTSFECIPCTTIALRRDLDAAEARAETAEAEIERLKDILGDPEGTIAHADAITARSETAEAALREAGQWHMNVGDGEILFEIYGKIAVSIEPDGMSYAIFDEVTGAWRAGKHDPSDDIKAAGDEIAAAAASLAKYGERT